MSFATNKSVRKAFIIYMLAFYSAWVACHLILFPYIKSNISSEFWEVFLKDFIIKNLLWTVPAILLAKHYANDLYIGLKEMFTNKVNWLKYILIYIGIILYVCGTAYFKVGKVEIVDKWFVMGIMPYIFVGLTEEMVFRGWFLNITIRNEDKIIIPVGINAIMFLIIHFPIWISEGIFVKQMASIGFFNIMLLSVIFSMLFIKSKNILVPIIFHMIWDISVSIFVM